MKQVITWIGGPTAVIGIFWAALVYLEALPVLQRDLNAIAAEVRQNSEDRLRDDLRELRIQRAKNERDIQGYQLQTAPVPDWLLEEQEDIKLEIEQVEQQLQEIRQ